MEKLTEFFQMGGFAAYVWPSFAVAALVMAAMVATTLRSFQRSRRTLAQLQESPGSPPGQ